MNDGLNPIETQRNQLLKTRLDQLQEILAIKKDQLKELYQLLKARDSLGNLLNVSTEDDNIIVGQEDTDCNAFVELYEHGSINDLKDWPTADLPSPLPPNEPERPASPLKEASATPPSETSAQAVPPSNSPSTEASSPSPEPIAEIPVEETQETDPYSDLASETAPKQEVFVPPSPSPSPSPLPEIHIPLTNTIVEDETVAPEIVETQPALSETTITDEVLVDSAIAEPAPSPEPIQDVAMEENIVVDDIGQQDQQNQEEPAAFIQPVSEDVSKELETILTHEDQIPNIQPPSSPLSSEIPIPEGTELPGMKSDTDEEEEKAVSLTVADASDLHETHESPLREVEAIIASPEHEEPPHVSPLVEEQPLPLSPIVDQMDQQNDNDMEDEPKAEISGITEADAETDVIEENVRDIDEVEPIQTVVPEPSAEAFESQEENLIAEKTVLDAEPSQELPLFPVSQEHGPDDYRGTDFAQRLHDDIEEGISSPIEDTREPLLRPMVLIDSPEEFESPTRSPTRSPSAVPQVLPSRVDDHVDNEEYDHPPVAMQENVNVGRMTRSRSRALEDSRTMEEVYAASRSASLDALPTVSRGASLDALPVASRAGSRSLKASQSVSRGASLDVLRSASRGASPGAPRSASKDANLGAVRMESRDASLSVSRGGSLDALHTASRGGSLNLMEELHAASRSGSIDAIEQLPTASRSASLASMGKVHAASKSRSLEAIEELQEASRDASPDAMEDLHPTSGASSPEEEYGTIEQPEAEVDQYSYEATQHAAAERERSVSEPHRIASAIASRQISERHDVDYSHRISKSATPAMMEVPMPPSPDSDVEMEDAGIRTVARESSRLTSASIRHSVDHTIVKMEEDEPIFNGQTSGLPIRFKSVSPRPSQVRSLWVNDLPSTIQPIASDLLFSAEDSNADDNKEVLDASEQTFPDTTLSPMPTSPILTPYADSIPLPRVDKLPATLSRKVHPAKLARKRDRERDKDGKDESKDKDKKETNKSTWLPWEISRWGAHFRANPAHKMMRKSGKALTTRMWGVAYNELKVMRALEQVEKLKQEGRWSFRQPKKQKGPLVNKSHWDWLMDEMKWLRADFREERRCKTAIAFNLAHAVREWHLASPEERKLLCVSGAVTRLGKTHPRSMEIDDSGDPPELPEPPHNDEKPLGTVDLPDVEVINDQIPDGPWQNSEEIDPEKEADIILKQQRERRALDEHAASTVWQSSPIDADGEDDADGEMDVDIEEEIKPIIDLTVEGELSQSILAPETSQENVVETPLSTLTGVKQSSADPVLLSSPEKLPGTSNSTVTDTVKAHLRTSLHTIADDETFLDIENLCSGLSQLSTVDVYTPLELPDLFPDYQVYKPLFPSPELVNSAVIPRTDKKVEKKERKVLEELIRVDETALPKVVNVSTFMQHRPLLVSALQPARRLRDGKWLDLEDTVVTGDETVPVVEPPPDFLFGSQRSRPVGVSIFGLSTRMPKDAQKRFNETPWSNSEDQLLKDIVDRYPNNWGLVADVFNSSRVTIINDRRTAWDCMVRWDVRWNDGKLLTPPNAPSTPEVTIGDIANPPQTPLNSHAMFNALMTRKRSASQMALTLPSQQPESRKRRRHNHMHEAMKKSAKKRETSMKQIIPNRRPNAQAHETHNAFGKPAHRTPAELSRMKAEKDRREFEEQQQQLRRKQEDDVARKRQMDMRQQQMQSAQPVSLPHVRGPNHPQVNISQQAGRLPLNAGNLPVPSIAQNVQIPAGVNLNASGLQRLTPEQQRVVYMQMQARQAQLAQQAQVQAQAQAQAQLQQVQTQQTPVQQQQQQQQAQQPGQTSQAHVQQHQPVHPQHPRPLSQPQQQQQQQQQSNVSVPSSTVVPGTPVIPSHSAMHPQGSPTPPQATIHHPTVPQVSPPRLGTPSNVNLMTMGSATPVLRPTVPQVPQQQRPGSTPQIPSVPSQPPRPMSTQIPPQPGQMSRPTLQQQQQQAAMHHHVFMQNMQNSGLSQEQIKRLYHNQLYWSNSQAQAQAMHAANMAYAQSAQQQQAQTPQQHMSSSPRPPSVQPNPNIGSAPPPPPSIGGP